jgi:hypothetical protein
VSLEGTRRIVLKSRYHTAWLHILRSGGEIHPHRAGPLRGVPVHRPALARDVPNIEQYVFDGMDLLYRNFFREIAQIPACNFCQVRYEDLIRTPIEELGRMYRQLQFGSLEKIRPRLEAYVRGLDRYGTNQHISHPAKGRRCTGAGIGTCTGSGITPSAAT